VKGVETIAKFRGLICLIAGITVILVCLVLFGISINALNSTYLLSLSYDEQVGLTDTISISGLILYIIFLSCGILTIGAGTFLNVKDLRDGDAVSKLLTFISGSVSIILALLMYSIILAQIHSLYY